MLKTNLTQNKKSAEAYFSHVSLICIRFCENIRLSASHIITSHLRNPTNNDKVHIIDT